MNSLYKRALPALNFAKNSRFLCLSTFTAELVVANKTEFSKPAEAAPSALLETTGHHQSHRVHLSAASLEVNENKLLTLKLADAEVFVLAPCYSSQLHR